MEPPGPRPGPPAPSPEAARTLPPTPSALPPVLARVVAFAAVVLAGAAGGLIGYSLVHLQCHGRCATPLGMGALVGSVAAAGGVALIAALVLRAMGEWRARTPATSYEANASRRKPSA